MLKALLTRARQGHRTMRYPRAAPPALPAHFRGAPQIDPTRCPDGCHACADRSTTAAPFPRRRNPPSRSAWA